VEPRGIYALQQTFSRTAAQKTPAKSQFLKLQKKPSNHHLRWHAL
jgi:hypothetical protein